jgi:hypothetical protein
MGPYPADLRRLVTPHIKWSQAALLLFALGMMAAEPVLARGGRGGHSGGRSSAHGSAPGARTGAHHGGGSHAGPRHFAAPRYAPRSRVWITPVIAAPLLFFPPPYYSPQYFPPPVIDAPPGAPIYIEQGDEQATPDSVQQYWYYCRESNAYYPYVGECPAGWQRVAPQPAQFSQPGFPAQG